MIQVGLAPRALASEHERERERGITSVPASP